MSPPSQAIKPDAEQENSTVTKQRVSQLESLHVSHLKDQSRIDEASPDPDIMVVSKKAFDKQMAEKDDQIKILINSVSNLQSQVQLLQRQLDLKEKMPGRSSSRDS